jgi:two-component system nitrate/nitrite response regulator NarL
MAAQTLTLAHDNSSHTDCASSSPTPAIPTALICPSFLLRSGLQHILRDTPFAIAEAVSVTGPKRLSIVPSTLPWFLLKPPITLVGCLR